MKRHERRFLIGAALFAILAILLVRAFWTAQLSAAIYCFCKAFDFQKVAIAVSSIVAVCFLVDFFALWVIARDRDREED